MKTVIALLLLTALLAYAQNSGYIACPANFTLGAGGPPTALTFHVKNPFSTMIYNTCPSSILYCNMTTPASGIYGVTYYGGVGISNLPTGSTPQLVVYVDGAPTNMVVNLTSGPNDLTGVNFLHETYPALTNAALFLVVLPIGSGTGTTLTVRPPVHGVCLFNFEWNEYTSKRDTVRDVNILHATWDVQIAADRLARAYAQ